VSGTAVWPPDMKRSLAAWLVIMSIATVIKFISMISAMGRIPAIDAPIAAPMIACSEIGVERTRRSPNLVDNPLLAPLTPPSSGSATSSPNSSTVGSAAMAWCRASLIAWSVVICLLIGNSLYRVQVMDEHVFVQLGGFRPGRRQRPVDGCLDRRFMAAVDGRELVFAGVALGRQPLPVAGHRVGGHRRLFLGLVHVAIGVAEHMAVEAESHGLDERRAAAIPGAVDRFLGRGVHRQRVVAID